MKPNLLRFLIAMLLWLATAPPSPAQTIDAYAVSNTSSWTFYGGKSFMVGYDVTPATNLQVTALGILDWTGSGLAAASQIGIWDSNGVLVASATLPSGAFNPQPAGAPGAVFYLTNISPVTLLVSNTYRIGNQMFGNNQPVVGWGGTYMPDPNLTFGQGWGNNEVTFAEPTEFTNNTPYMGPVFAYALPTQPTNVVHYVDLNSPNPTPPYTTWGTASTDIQSAIDASSNGDLIWVNDGVYQTGGRVVYGSLTNRVAINKAVTVQSVNGPGATIINGYQDTNTILGDDAVRCAYLASNAILSGFTLSFGATRNAGDANKEESGGGVWCETTSSIISNCVITASDAYYQGGGLYQGTLLNSTLSGNAVISNSTCYGGAASQSILILCTVTSNTNNPYTRRLGTSESYGGAIYNGAATNCVIALNFCGGNSGSAYGGGACNANLANCIIASNVCNGLVAEGGGIYGGSVINSPIIGNSCDYSFVFEGLGGGAYNSSLVNCTIAGNFASAAGGGTYNASEVNCINYFNSSTSLYGINYATNAYLGSASYCCSTPLLNGTQNISRDPLLAGQFHLAIKSPCRGAGNSSATSGTDIDGDSWSNPPSIGCDEIKPGNETGNITIDIAAPYTNFAAGYASAFQAGISGSLSYSVWNFGDGTLVTNEAYAFHAWATNGDYLVTLTGYNDSYRGGQTATLAVHVGIATSPSTYYVDLNCFSPVPPKP